MLEAWTLEDGAQRAEATAERLVAWLGAARRSLDLALYDVRLPGPVGDAVAGALRAAIGRGVTVRIAYNDDSPGPDKRPFEPPPPSTQPHVLERLGAQLKGIPGWVDLMHHKFAVRDATAVWTGSANWTLDSWTRQENVLATVQEAAVARAYARVFKHLWEKGSIGSSGDFDTPGPIRPWFCPGRGPELSHRIAKRIGQARRRVRVASPLLTSGPILAAVNESQVDLAGVCDLGLDRRPARPLSGDALMPYEEAAPALDGDFADLEAGVRARLARIGVLYRPTSGRPAFPLDPIPRVIAAADWAPVEGGLAQRVRALNAFVADAYGARRIVAEGVCPSA